MGGTRTEEEKKNIKNKYLNKNSVKKKNYSMYL